MCTRRLVPLIVAALLFVLGIGSSGAWAAPVSATTSKPAAALRAWSARLRVGTVPKTIYGEATFAVSLELRNTGSRAWPSTGADAVQVAYHWLGRRGSIVVWDGQRTAISASVPPGGSTNVSAVVAVPATPGRYRLEFDLVSRASRWFSQQGWVPTAVAVTVGSTASSYFAATIVAPALPAGVQARSVSSVTVRLTNTGTLRWLRSGPDAVFVSYHWVRADGSYVVWDGRRTSLTHPVDPKATVGQPVVVESPSVAGRYALQVDLISSQVGWFSRLGSVGPRSNEVQVGSAKVTHTSSTSRWLFVLAAIALVLVAAALVSVVRLFRRPDVSDEVDVAASPATLAPARAPRELLPAVHPEEVAGPIPMPGPIRRCPSPGPPSLPSSRRCPPPQLPNPRRRHRSRIPASRPRPTVARARRSSRSSRRRSRSRRLFPPVEDRRARRSPTTCGNEARCAIADGRPATRHDPPALCKRGGRAVT